MIKYLGSKKKLLSKIIEEVKKENVSSVLDAFSGTARVGAALSNEGFDVTSNDITTFGFFLASTYVQACAEDYPDLEGTVKDLQDLTVKEVPGWFSKNYSIEAPFFQIQNSLKIETIREFLRDRYQGTELEKILTVSLMEAADRVDSTCGIQMAFLKSWAPRAFNDLQLRVPNFSKGRGKVIQGDAMDAVKMEVDLVYLDPPYNQHSYLANYHIWETLCKWDNPETYGVVKKRRDVQERKSKWNSKKESPKEFESLISNIVSSKVMVSFNDEGFLTSDFIMEVLQKNFSVVEKEEIPYSRYVGSKIGIYNQKSEKVGTVKKISNNEILFFGRR